MPKPILPTIELPDLISDETLLQIREPIEADGNIHLSEIVVISKLIVRYKPNRIFEIGTFDGRTTLNMAANCAPDAKVYTLDLPKDQRADAKLPLDEGDAKYIDKEKSGSRYVGTDCEPKITQLYGDSAAFDFSQFANTIDFIFIDGSHAYDYVLSDSRQALNLLRNGKGVILWHDYNNPWWEGVTRALNELYSAGNEFSGMKHIEGTTLACLVIP